MTLQPVKSSNVDSVGYDPATRTLRVKFKSGGTYDFLDVEPESHQEFINAASVGRHFHKHIRGQFESRKLD